MSITSKTYRIVLDGKQYTGTAEDVARWYCQHRGVNLFIESTEEDYILDLRALFRDAEDPKHIEYFEDNVADLEDCYSAFFEYYLQQEKDEDCSIWECTQFNTRSRAPSTEDMNRLYPERDAEVAGRNYQVLIDNRLYTGTAEDIARCYCLQKGIKLYIDQLERKTLGLYALFPQKNTLTKITSFDKGEDTDIESGYRLFFSDYLREGAAPDCKVFELPKVPPTTSPQEEDALKAEMLKYLKYASSERNLGFNAAIKIACAAIECEGLSCEVKAVMQYVQEIYPLLAEIVSSN